MIQIGHVHELTRYPVKSMAGVAAESAFLGWHGLEGDRRFAFRRLEDKGGFPFLTASRLAELLLFHPTGLRDDGTGEPQPTHIRTPDGRELELHGPELQQEISDRLGSPVELMHFRNGIFDDASVSLINLETIAGIGSEFETELDCRRFRANVVIDMIDTNPFMEDGWVGGTLLFGDADPKPAVHVTKRDARCMMINLDPDTAKQDARVLKSVVRANNNNAGVYGTVLQTGTIRVGQSVSLVLP